MRRVRRHNWKAQNWEAFHIKVQEAGLDELSAREVQESGFGVGRGDMVGRAGWWG